MIGLEYLDPMVDFLCAVYYHPSEDGTITVHQLLTGDYGYPDFLSAGTGRTDSIETEVYSADPGKPEKENLLKILEQIVEDRRFLYGVPRVDRYTCYIGEEDWMRMMGGFQTKTTTTFTSRFIEFLRDSNLHPAPYDEEKGQWTAKCVSGYSHRMMIDAYSDEFGCGWCRRKGGQQELQEWIDENKLKANGNAH